MKRARKAAIVDSLDSDNDGGEENSDYEPDIQTKKGQVIELKMKVSKS